MLCEVCEGITLERLRRKYQHAPSFKALKSSASSCSLCALLWNAVITHAGCELCLEDLTEIHEEPIILEAWSEKRSLMLCYVRINSHGEDFLLPGRAFGEISLFAAPGEFAK